MRPPAFLLRAGAAAVDGAVLFAAFYFIVKLFLAVSGSGDASFEESVDLPFIRPLEFAITGLSAAYFTLLTGRDGRTLGKRAAGLQVVRTDGSAMTYGRALGRWLGYNLCVGTVGAGFIAAAFTNNQVGLHDFVAGTRVITAKAIPKLRRRALSVYGFLAAVTLSLAALAVSAEIVLSFLR